MNRARELFFILVLCGTLFACTQIQDIIATIDNEEVTQSSFDAYLDYKQISQDSTGQTDEHLNEYIDSEAITLAIEKATIYQKNNLEAEINELKKEWLLSRYLKAFLAEMLTDSAIQDYHASSDNTLTSKKAHVAHILVRTTPSMDDTERRSRYTRALNAYNQLKTGSDFAQIVTQYSDDSLSASKAGDLGWVSEGTFNPQFTKLAFNKLKANEISKPFQSKFGFHIIKLLAEPTLVKKPLNEVENEIRALLLEKLKKEEMERLMTTVTISRT